MSPDCRLLDGDVGVLQALDVYKRLRSGQVVTGEMTVSGRRQKRICVDLEEEK